MYTVVPCLAAILLLGSWWSPAHGAFNLPNYEIAVLQDLYDTTNGESWVWIGKGSVWDFDDPNPCKDTWQGIHCSDVPNNGYFHVLGLNLTGYNLQGALPHSLGNFSEIEWLELSGNYIVGQIPRTLGNLLSLALLTLGGNQLTGTIPSELGNCTSLVALSLDFNQLHGTIPTSLSQCTKLRALVLVYNRLTGSIPASFGHLTELADLLLEHNQLTGFIPDRLGRCTLLERVYLGENLLTGTIPTAIGNWTSATEIYLEYNALTGSIPSTVGQCTQLVDFYVPVNQLTGPVPESLFQCTGLVDLELSANFLTGTISSSVGQLQQLQYFFAYTNLLTGTLPAELGSCSQLSQLYLSENHLSGQLPDALGQCQQLVAVDLDTNCFTGTIPASLAQCTRLIELYLYANVLTGAFPAWISRLPQLEVTSFDANQLTGTLPPDWLGSPLLKYLDVGVNYLTGTIPPGLADLTYLNILGLNDNRFTGTIGQELWDHLSQVVILLNLNANYLTGSIPATTANKSTLSLLNLSENLLSGTLPSALVNAVSSLYALYLFSNHLSGTLPQIWDGVAFSVAAVDLHSNRLRGQIPAALGYCPQLLALDLSNNDLTGTIPTSFSTLTSLQALKLSHNNLGGGIAEIFGNRLNLSVIQLSGNQLTGTLPANVFRLPVLSAFAAVDNCFDGPLPAEAICNSSTLQSLVLDGLHSSSSCSNRGEQLGGGFKLGTLPSCLFAMSALTTLHISGTGLTGTLPALTGISTALSDLSLSHNLLTGTVPNAFLDRSWSQLDLSYNRLAGALDGARSARYTLNTTLSLQQNRLSGGIPGSVHHVGSLSLLESNLFSCRWDRSDLPSQDPDRKKYTCGSDSVNGALYVWLGFGVTALLLCGVALLRRMTTISELRRWIVTPFKGITGSPLPALTHICEVGNDICSLAVGCAVYCLAVLLPMYALMGSTYTHSYAWTLSGAYHSGTTALALMVVFLSVHLLLAWQCGTLMQTFRRTSLAVDQSTGAAQPPQPLRHRLYYYALILFSLLVMVGVNVAFVQATLHLNGHQLAGIQVMLAIFKLSYNRFVAPALQLQVQRLRGDRKGNASKAVEVTTGEIALAVVNTVVIPCVVVAFISPNCFYNALKGMEAVTSSYAYTGVCESIVFSADLSSYTCFTHAIETEQTSYTPPFVYSYQCSSSFVTSYAPMYVAMCIMTTFVVPLQHVTMLWLSRSAPRASWLRWILDITTPRILRELPHGEGLQRLRSNALKFPTFHANQFVVSLLTYLALLLTFGVLFPPLAVCCAAAIVSTVLVARWELNRYLSTAVAFERQDCIEELESACPGVATASQLRRALVLILAMACVFYTMFLFDTLGDAVGFGRSYWVLIVVPLLPLAAHLCWFVQQYWCCPDAPTDAGVPTSAETAGGDLECAVELRSSQVTELPWREINPLHRLD